MVSHQAATQYQQHCSVATAVASAVAVLDAAFVEPLSQAPAAFEQVASGHILTEQGAMDCMNNSNEAVSNLCTGFHCKMQEGTGFMQ